MILRTYFGILTFIFSFSHFHTMYSCCLRNDKFGLQKNNSVSMVNIIFVNQGLISFRTKSSCCGNLRAELDAAMSQHINDPCVCLGLKLWINQVHNDCLFGKEWILYLIMTRELSIFKINYLFPSTMVKIIQSLVFKTKITKIYI